MTTTNSSMRVVSKRVLAILAVAFSPALVTSQAPAVGEFVEFRGTDTASVERFTRDASSLSGEIFQRGFHTRYTARLRADQSVEHLEFDGEGNVSAQD